MIIGCIVFTLPPKHSGNSVTESTLVTAIPASSNAFAVPPVERISCPKCTNSRANSSIPALFETERSARLVIGERAERT